LKKERLLGVDPCSFVLIGNRNDAMLEFGKLIIDFAKKHTANQQLKKEWVKEVNEFKFGERLFFWLSAEALGILYFFFALKAASYFFT
jgi:hypothetical protein